MTTQETIIRTCNHTDRQRSDVQMGKGERVLCCCECWNASVHARRSERKQELSEHWQAYREQQDAAMQAAGASEGQRVAYFARSLLGFGGIVIKGTITRNRNGIAVVKMDTKQQGKRYTEWCKEWRPIAQ